MTLVTERHVCTVVETCLRQAMPRREDIWEMARGALQAIDRSLDTAIQVHVPKGSLPEDAQRAQRALGRMREALHWLETHRWGMFRIDLCRHLRRAQRNAVVVLDIVEAAQTERYRRRAV